MRLSIAFAAAFMLAAPASAHDFKLGDLVVAHPFSLATTKAALAGAGYLEVTNTGTAGDRLVAVRSEFPRTMIHTTTIDDAGVAKMGHVADGIPIAAGETVILAPGGTHVMFMGLSAGLTEGDSFDATLVFEHAGEIVVTFKVEARAEATESHSGH